MGIFCFERWETLKTARRQRLSKEGIKKHLIESITINNAAKIEELNELAEKVDKPEDAADTIKQYEKIL